MLENSSTAKFDNIMVEFKRHADLFYLVGSRFFGNMTPESDWDFFVADSVQIRPLLRGLGFKVSMDSSYSDRLCLDVWGHDECRIHVQIVDRIHVNSRKIIRDLLKKSPMFVNLPKRDRALVWRIMSDVLYESPGCFLSPLFRIR